MDKKEELSEEYYIDAKRFLDDPRCFLNTEALKIVEETDDLALKLEALKALATWYFFNNPCRQLVN